MGQFVTAHRADGSLFQQWRRTEENETLPSHDSYCLICGEPYVDVRGEAPERTNGKGLVIHEARWWIRYDIRHNYVLHKAWTDTTNTKTAREAPTTHRRFF